MKKKLVYMILVILVMSLVVGCGKDDKANFVTSLDPKTKIVREGHLNEYPNTKIGDAYDTFFSNAQWKYFEEKNKEKVVEFSGNCMFHDKEINVRQQFVLQESDKFSVGALSFNDIPQDQLTCAALIGKVYDTYNQKNQKRKLSEGKNEVGVVQKAQNLLTSKNVQGTVLATSFGNNQNGFLSLTKNNNRYSFVIYDIKNQQVAEVPFFWTVYDFMLDKNKKSPSIFKMTIFNDKQDQDAKAGVWNGANHMIPIYALYEFDQSGKVIPGRLTTGVGEKPSHYQGFLMEQKNVDIANLLLTEMIALHGNVKANNVDMSFD